MIYHRNSRSSHYSYTELFLHVSEVKKIFPTATGGIKHGQATLTLFLRPTKDSIEYTVKLYAKQGSKSVKVFVVNINYRNQDSIFHRKKQQNRGYCTVHVKSICTY